MPAIINPIVHYLVLAKTGEEWLHLLVDRNRGKYSIANGPINLLWSYETQLKNACDSIVPDGWLLASEELIALSATWDSIVLKPVIKVER